MPEENLEGTFSQCPRALWEFTWTRLRFGDFCRQRFGDFRPQNWFSSPIRRGEVKHWKSNYNVRPSISLTYAMVLRRMFKHPLPLNTLCTCLFSRIFSTGGTTGEATNPCPPEPNCPKVTVKRPTLVYLDAYVLRTATVKPPNLVPMLATVKPTTLLQPPADGVKCEVPQLAGALMPYIERRRVCGATAGQTLYCTVLCTDGQTLYCTVLCTAG